MMGRRSGASGGRLLGDIGGTYVRLGVQRPGHVVRRIRRIHSPPESPVETLIEGYLQRLPPAERPRVAAFSVAGPVLGDDVRLTNRRWQFSREKLRSRLDLDRLEVVNDFAAVALSIPHLASGVVKVGAGRRRSGAMAVLGPGTGLGVAGLLRSGEQYHPIASEGGHVPLAPVDDDESEILRLVRNRVELVTAETLLSGPGLTRLYQAVTTRRVGKPHTLAPSTITRRAVRGTCDDCVTTVNLFCRFLGTVASGLALTLAAVGGVYVAGGIVPRILPLFRRSGFRRRFETNPTHAGFLKAITTYVVTKPLAAFPGLIVLLDGADS